MKSAIYYYFNLTISEDSTNKKLVKIINDILN